MQTGIVGKNSSPSQCFLGNCQLSPPTPLLSISSRTNDFGFLGLSFGVGDLYKEHLLLIFLSLALTSLQHL